MGIKHFIDKVLNKIDRKIAFPLLATKRRKKLKYTDFTVISNNCWGGVLYEYFNLKKQSPTVGAYFYAEDYVRFCSNLAHYLSFDLTFISAEESHNRDDLYRKKQQDVIIGKLDDVEIVFLHYHDEKTILEKWKRRSARINWNRVILKFSFQNNCTDDLIRKFMEIPNYKKICFVGGKVDGCDGIIYFPRHNEKKETIDETDNFGRWFDITDLINSALDEDATLS